MSRFNILLHRALLALVLLAGNIFVSSSSAADGISLTRTRVIFLSSEKAQSVTMQNHGSRPYLIQSAVIDSPDGHIHAPFLTTPPLFRLEGNSKNTIRILRKSDASLPSDRESVFYFTAIAVPAVTQVTDDTEAGMTARVSVGLRNTIKLFYRPVGLSMLPEEAEGRLTFDHLNGRVVVKNPTPYNLTFSQLKFDGKEINVRDSVSMVPPFSQVDYPASAGVRQAQWTVINDYGGISPLYKTEIRTGGTK